MAFEIVDNAKQLERKPDLDAALTVLDSMNLDAMDHVVVDVIVPNAEADFLNQIPFNVGVTADKFIPSLENSKIYSDLGLTFKSGAPCKNIYQRHQIADHTKVVQAIRDIYDEEKKYLQKLKQYQKDYVDYIQSMDQDQIIPTEQEFFAYFKDCCPSVKNLIVASEDFLGKLRTPQASVDQVCTVFVEAADENKPFFQAFRAYQKVYKTASHKIQTAKEKNMGSLLKAAEKLGRDPTQSIDTLRALPTQRFPVYRTALETITQNTHPSDPHYQLIVKAHGDMHLATLSLDEGQKMKDEFALLPKLDDRLGAAGQLVKTNMFYICELHCSVVNDKHNHIGDVTLILYNRQLAIVERKVNHQKRFSLLRKKSCDLSSLRWKYRVSTIHDIGTITAIDLPEHDFRLVTLRSQVADSRPLTSEDTLNFYPPLQVAEGLEKCAVTYRAESKESKDLFLRAFRDTEVKMKVLRKENARPDVFSPTNLYVDQHNNIDIYFNIVPARDALGRSSVCIASS
ncbi:Dbl homology domain-containing protein [Phlyctochytrium arcticum]|nr:Dbl homology domain-containing protein [Phlyctochytrium arcticum]